MKKFILVYIGIICLLAANAQAATHLLPLVETEISMLFGIGIVGFIVVKRKKKK
ncbi:MAG: hypothetical protein ABFS43_06480 [Thermodesulfobacteriota bacterium]